MRYASIATALLLAGCADAGGGAQTDSGSTTTPEPSSSGAQPSTEGTSGTASTTTDADSSDSGDSTGMPAPNESPIAVARSMPRSGVVPWAATLDGSQSADPDGELVSWSWSWDGGAAQGESASADFAQPGCVEVTLTVTDDEGATATDTLVLSTAAAAPPEAATATLAAMPRPSALLPRDLETDLGTARFEGTLETEGFAEVRANVLSEGVVVDSVAMPICGAAPAPFELDVPIPAQLQAYDVQLVAAVGEVELPLAEVTDLVAGDVYLVNGQSNAFAAMYGGDADVNQTPFLRSFGLNDLSGPITEADTNWYPAAGNGAGGPGGIGQWPLRMANALSDAHQVPIAVINGARGGQPIGHFQRNDADPADLATNYGRLLYRMRAAGLDQQLRAILWYQGESDGIATMAHQEGFDALMADWAEDYPEAEQLYVTQVRLGCGGDTVGIQEYQRTLPDTVRRVSVMSTTGLDSHDGCHYAYVDGYEALGDRYAALLGRDLYGETPAADAQPPNPASATLHRGGTQIVITMRNDAEPLVFDAGAEADFRVEGSAVTVVSGAAEPGQITLSLSGDATGATGISYLGHPLAGPWVASEAGLGLLTFLALPLR